jgi:hypothetical protein
MSCIVAMKKFHAQLLSKHLYIFEVTIPPGSRVFSELLAIQPAI